jgi:putative copper export protein
MALLGLGAFILVMAAGPYLRNGMERRQLMRRFRKLAIPLVIAGALALLVLTII